MRRVTSAVVAAALALLTSAAGACGFCIEDKVAATYDHAVVERALGRGQDVLFLEIVQTDLVSKQQWRQVVAAVQATAGVQRASVRTARAPATLSFALDPGKSTPAAAMTCINGVLQKRGLKVGLIRVLNERALKKS